MNLVLMFRSGSIFNKELLLPDPDKEMSALKPNKKDRAIIYFHIGKTGGTTLDKVLLSNCNYYSEAHPFYKQCINHHLGKKEITLSKLTKITVHMWRPYGNQFQRIIQSNNITSFLFTIRNPLDRAVSAFNFEHINNTDIDHLRHSRWGLEEGMKLKNVFYNQCFPSVEDLALTLARKTTATAESQAHDAHTRDEYCYDLGLKAIEGKGSEMQGGHHLKYNYRYYWERIKGIQNADMEVFVIRTEHLWNDTDILNQSLGGNATDITEEMRRHRFTYKSEKNIVKTGLSKEGKLYMCCFLSHENELFERVVKDAVNLDEVEKIRYVKDLYNDCGVESGMKKNDDVEVFTPFNWTEWHKEKCNFDHA